MVANPTEAYLRIDLRCGSPDCRHCPPSKAPHLPAGVSHIAIPNADVLDAWLEVFELPALSGFVVLSSVLRKVCVHVLHTHQRLGRHPRRSATLHTGRSQDHHTICRLPGGRTCG